MPPRLDAPIVSPWYAPVNATKRVRFACPLCCQNCAAIFNATSMAVEPSSEKNTRVSESAGQSATNSCASCAAGGWVKPRNDVCATRSSCARIASSMRGCRWPWRFVQIEELPSRYSRPSLSRSTAPAPSTSTSGSWPGAPQS